MKFVDMISGAMAAGELPGTEGLVGNDGEGGLVDASGRAIRSESPAPAAGVEPGAGESLSEWGVAVVGVLGFEDIPGADAVTVARFTFSDGYPADYPVVVRKDDYEAGDMAVYVPVDAVLPDEPEFSFLGSARRRLKAKKLRGVYSEGLLVPMRDFAAIMARKVPNGVAEGVMDAAHLAEQVYEALLNIMAPGTDVGEMMGISRWTQRVSSRMPGQKAQPDESVCPIYSVSNAKKGEGINRLSGDTRVIVTEKLHGANIRFSVDEDGYNYLGSHRTKRNAADAWKVLPNQDWFQRCAAANSVFEKLNDNKVRGMAFYGEVLGVQDLNYGDTPANPGLRIFDVYAIAAGKWLDWPDVVELCRAAGFDHAPVLYDGPLEECPYRELAEGLTTIDGANHVREGVVIRTYRGGGPSRRWKYVSQGYRLRSGSQTDISE